MTEQDETSEQFPTAIEVVDRLEADVVRAMAGGTGSVTVPAWALLWCIKMARVGISATQETEAHSCLEA